MFIPDPIFSIPDPAKNLSIFNPKNFFYALGNMILIPGPEAKKHRIPDPNTQTDYYVHVPFFLPILCPFTLLIPFIPILFSFSPILSFGSSLLLSPFPSYASVTFFFFSYSLFAVFSSFFFLSLISVNFSQY
jgi:hypothetical protein